MAVTTTERRSRELERKNVPRIRTDAVDTLPAFSEMTGRGSHGSCQARRPRPTGLRASNRALVAGSVWDRSLPDSARSGDADASARTKGGTDENPGPGGAIHSTSIGTLTISQSTLADNSTTGYGQGGGAIMTSAGAVTISRSTLSGNSTNGVTAEGGAIKSESGAVTISNSTLSGNRTTNNYSNGGAVYANSGSIPIWFGDCLIV